jgi:hypothetical protein
MNPAIATSAASRSANPGFTSLGASLLNDRTAHQKHDYECDRGANSGNHVTENAPLWFWLGSSVIEHCFGHCRVSVESVFQLGISYGHGAGTSTRFARSVQVAGKLTTSGSFVNLFAPWIQP